MELFLTLLLMLQPPEATRDDPAKADWPVACNLLVELAETVAINYSGRLNRGVTAAELYVAAAEQLCRAAGQELAKADRDRLAAASRFQAARYLLEIREKLGDAANLAGMRTFLVGSQGFNTILDPHCGLFWNTGTTAANSECEFGFGFELTGVNGLEYLQFMLESSRPLWQARPAAMERLKSPAAWPWTVSRVIPGSPAAQAGLRVDDQILQVNGQELTPTNQHDHFRKLVSLQQPAIQLLADPEGIDVSKPLKLLIRRGDTQLSLSLPRVSYVPEAIFGLNRRPTGEANFWLDPREKLAYIRIGSVETGSDAAFREVLTDLLDKELRGLVLDLRWCPGGYTNEISGIVGALLPNGATIATIQARPNHPRDRKTYSAERSLIPKLPLVVLVNGQTTGGGEMMAAALQDHQRAVIVGQRTFGKANIMDLASTPIPNLVYRVSTGFSLRPNGVNRHRFPDSLPTDPWGVRPTKGYEAPTTHEFSRWLLREVERLAIRPAGDRTALPLDDPHNDPQKLLALKVLREQLAK